jgi:hypothetical protein
MTNDEIRELYDSDPDLVLSDLMLITGKSIEELIKILMEVV